MLATQTQIEDQFSAWAPWKSRRELPGIHDPGVYLLAQFEPGAVPIGSADPNGVSLVYVGETCGQTRSLYKRLRTFNRVAFESDGTNPKRGHSGAKTYSAWNGKIPEHLHVAIRPVTEFQGRIREAFIRFLERKVIWEFTSRTGNWPCCNGK